MRLVLHQKLIQSFQLSHLHEIPEATQVSGEEPNFLTSTLRSQALPTEPATFNRRISIKEEGGACWRWWRFWRSLTFEHEPFSFTAYVSKDPEKQRSYLAVGSRQLTWLWLAVRDIVPYLRVDYSRSLNSAFHQGREDHPAKAQYRDDAAANKAHKR